MSRDQRIEDNWALLYAQQKALELNHPLIIAFFLVEQFQYANPKIFAFMLEGLESTAKEAEGKSISFVLRIGVPADELPKLINETNAGLLVTDFSPLKIKLEWIKRLQKSINIGFVEVDAHNIVTCWVASDKKEFGARTIRPKIQKLLPDFLTEFPEITNHPFRIERNLESISFLKAKESLSLKNVKPYTFKSGSRNGIKIAKDFFDKKLDGYGIKRSYPRLDATSNLSPYLHFGQVGAQRIALMAEKSTANKEDLSAFLDELIIRRELADNFCNYEENYYNLKGLPNWARETLEKHSMDKRPYLYTFEQLENYETNDGIWNFAQKQMVDTGKMHGYLRMYWAKKILEWTHDPHESLEVAIYLNDKYELDGRDPNGYAGISWSIGGLHDRPWKERLVFGKIRYMSQKGTVSKYMNEKGFDKF
jgi:deoxyribodipyrimidine photo-lyase